MVNQLVCDSCEQPITDMNNRVQILIFTTEPIADPTLDLCPACASNMKKDAKVKRGQDKAKEKIKAMSAPVIPTTVPVEGIHPESGEYLDMKEPMPAVVPGIDPRTGKGQRADGRPNEWHGPGEWKGNKDASPA